MKINELCLLLYSLSNKHGNLEVFCYDPISQGDFVPSPIVRSGEPVVCLNSSDEKPRHPAKGPFCECWFCLNTGPKGECEKCGLQPAPGRRSVTENPNEN